MSIVYVQKSCMSNNFFRSTKKRQERKSPPLKLFKQKSKSEPFTRYKYLVRIILTWCRWPDLNRHELSFEGF